MSDNSKALFLVVALVGLLYLSAGQQQGCSLVSSPPTAVVYTYEKDDGTPPAAVSSGLNKLNHLTPPIIATVDEVDTKSGSGGIPDQYKISRPAAKAVGLPALVVLAKDKVLRTVKAPTTEEQVLAAVK